MKYKIAEITIEIKEDGTPMFWGYSYGFHAGQGGMDFTYGNYGSESIDQILEVMKSKLTKDLNTLVKMAKDKHNKKDE